MASEFCCAELENWQDTTTTTTTPRVPMKEQSLSRSRGQSFSSGNSSAAVAKVEKKNESGERLPNYVRVLMVTDVNGRRKQLYIPAALDLERPKRPRTTFTERQLHALERQFEDNHFIGETKRQKLAVELGLTETQIKVWFQNRRTKCRRLGECGNRSRSSTGSQDNFFSGPEESTTRDKFMLPMTKTGGGLHLPPFRASPLPLPTSTTMNTTPWSPDFHRGFATTLLHHYEHTAFRPPQETQPNRYHKL